jgi:hypothetical protein
MNSRVNAFRASLFLWAVAAGLVAAAVMNELNLAVLGLAIAVALTAYASYRFATAIEGGIGTIAVANRSGMFKARSFTVGIAEPRRVNVERLARDNGYDLDGEWQRRARFGRTTLIGRFVRRSESPTTSDIRAR